MTRNVAASLRNSLLKEEEFSYAHLVKFEKPLKTVDGKSAHRANDYTYLSDGSFDVVFDDASRDIQNNLNGAQTYVANKILKVGSTSETTEARASSITLTVSAAALSTSFIDNLTITSGSVTSALTDFVEAGFREGDVIRLLSVGGTNDTAKVRINSFSNNNKTVNITALTKISSGVEASISSLTAEGSRSYSVNFASAEVESILNNRSSTGYARYINRDVFIYKAHIDKDTGAIIGAPYLLFKGIIASGKISEDPSKQSIVTWSITSHWGDFQRVSGRLTSDPYHRALDGNGNPDTDALVRPAYATDLGFLHSEAAVNLMAIYQVNETRYKEKKRGGFAGLIGGKKLVEYQVEVDREVDLRFNLDAKYLPIVYGVNKIDSIPVFVDSLSSNSKKVYVAYALCEGEIGGLYDIYFDDTNSICLDANDSSTRSSQTENSTVDVLCSGRMDRGDTLLANSATSGTSTYGGHPGALGGASWEAFENPAAAAYYVTSAIGNPNASFGSGSSSSAAGITHEKGHSFTTPIDTRLIFHSGKSDQKADALLVSQASNFKVGNDYYDGAAEYWGASHRLLDTAYVVAEYTISEGETNLPSLDFVVRGKGVECYNYDFSFEQDPDYSSTDAASSVFNIGDSVTLTATSGGGSLGSATIADIYNLTDLDGTTSIRIRFLEEPPLSYSSETGFPSVTAFAMTSGSNSFHLVTHNHTVVSGSVARKLEETITSVSNNSNSGVDLTLSGANATMLQALDFSNLLGLSEGVLSTADIRALQALINNYTFSRVGNQARGVGQTTTSSSSLVNKKAVLKDVVALDSNASATDDVYNGRFIEVTHVYSDNTVKVQKRKIIDYDGSTKVVKVETQFEEDAIPTTNDTYKIFSVSNDIRVSTNPAMQLFDYLTEKRYGRDLLLEDLDLPSFLQAARACDTRSDVTILTTVATVQVGSVYKYSTSAGKVLFQGEVKSITSKTIGNTNYKAIVFTNVSGKLVSRWEDWKYFYIGELYYYAGTLYEATANGVSGLFVNSNVLTSLNLSKVSGSGASNIVISLSTGATFEGNPVIKTLEEGGSFSSGYSLYDSDDVKYWRYIGWESQNQRHVTRHQTNAVINTANSVFDNVNSMLSHFNGILRYSSGKYSLAVKTASTTPTTTSVDGISYTLGDISDEDIIGQINVEDSGQKGTYNQVSITVNDPQNRFEGRSVSLFNSDYLKEDRMVPKKGTSTTPYITNYFNARLNAKQYLDESRAGLKTSFTLGPKGLLLRAGDIIRITYSRFGWVNKLYRVKNLNFQENCLVQVTAEEHNDDGYLIQPKRSNVVLSADPIQANMAAPSAPNISPTLSASQNDRGGIVLSWTNTSTFNPAIYTVQIYRNTSNNRSGASIIGISKGDNFTDNITAEGQQTFYYWIRYSVNVPVQRTTGVAPREVFSSFFPASATGGIAGISDGAIDASNINLTNDNVTVTADQDGNVTSFANTGTSIVVFIGTTQLAYDNSGAHNVNNSFRITNVVSVGVTPDSSPSITSNSYALGNITAMSGDVGTITYSIAVRDSLGRTVTYDRIQTFTKSSRGLTGPQGNPGAAGATGPRTATGIIYYQVAATNAPSAPTASSFNFSSGAFSSLTSNWGKNAPTFAGSNQNKYWYAGFTVAESTFGGSQTISFGTVTQAIGFTGLVSFSNGNTFGDGTNQMSFGASGTTLINGGNITTGVINLGNSSGMAIRQGKTAFGQNTAGFFIGNDNGTAKLDIGTNASHIRWNGSSLSVAGNITITSTQINSALGYTPTDDTAAAAAQSTANTATSNAAAAQSTANTATSNAAAAQSTANTATSNAAAAQSTANTATSNAATAQSTANTANSRAQNFDTSGDIFQGISVGTGGHVRGGQSAFNNGVGFFLGYSGSAYKFSIGNSSGQRLTWNGSTLSINGDITITSTQINSALGYTPTDDTAAAAAQSTANTAVSNASSAQSTANTAVSNASSAQSTANTAVSNASSAQSTANTAVSNAAAAQSTANTANSNAAAAQATANSKLSSSDVTQTFIEGKITNAASFRTDIAAYASSNPSGFTTFAAGDVQNAIANNVTDISGGKITTGTIDAANVSVINLSASNISTGTLNAERINLGTTTFETDSAGRLVIKSGGVVTDNIGANQITSSDNSFLGSGNTLSFNQYGLVGSVDITSAGGVCSLWISFEFLRSLSSRSVGFTVRITQGCSSAPVTATSAGVNPSDGGTLVATKFLNTAKSSSNAGHTGPITIFHQFNSSTTGANKINVYAKTVGGTTGGTLQDRDVMILETKR